MSSENHEQPLLIGLTGGIGSGKTTIAKIFQALGIPVFNADEAGRNIYDDPKVIGEVSDLLGNEILDDHQKVIRKRIAEKVFRDPSLLQKLNSIIHPKVKAYFEKWKAQLPLETPYLLRESAILFEAGLAPDHDFIIHVSAPLELRLIRASQRDHASMEDIRSRAERQWSDEQRINHAHFNILNDGIHPVIPAVIQIHQRLIHESTQHRRNQRS